VGARRARFSVHDAAALLRHPKRLGITEDQLWHEVSRPKGLDRGNGREGWSVTIYAQPHGNLRAKLSVGSAPIEGLDHHRRASTDRLGGRVPGGYHWDVFHPVAQRRKETIEPQPSDRYAVLKLLIDRWNLVLEEPDQGELLP
jgi:hypothetical protein